MADHAWCHDIARDAAVRAAEDNRQGPLPTLGEAIVLAFGFDKASAQRACDEVNSWPEDVQKDCRFVLGNLLEQGVERCQALVQGWRYGNGLMMARYPEMLPKSGSPTSAPEQENKGDGMATNGLRTERVVLEITQFNNSGYKPASEWDWEFFLRGEALTHGESVRVVEEAESDADSEMLRRSLVASEMRRLKVEAERDAAIRDRDESRQIAQTFESLCLGEQARNKVLKARVVELEAARITQALTADRFASAVQEADKLRARVEELESQLESVACRAATAETALGEIRSLDYTREAVNGAAWQANHIAAKALEAASGKPATDADRVALVAKMERCGVSIPPQAESGGNQPETPVSSTQAASGGGDGEPVAYLLDGPFEKRAFRTRDELYAYRRYLTEIEKQSMQIVPLYAAPSQPRGWLTESQSAAIKAMINLLKDRKEYPSGFTVYEDELDSLEDLLARSSPPEVVKPGTQVRYHSMSVEDQRDAQWIASLAAAGVAVKEAR